MPSASRNGKDHIVAAFDLGDLFTSRQVRDRLQRAESLAGKEVDLNALTKLITSLKGVTFTVQATDRLSGMMRVDFGESPTQFKSIAKALMFEALETNGMMLDDEIKNWAVAVEAKAVTLRGRLSIKGLRMLTNLIPFPAETLALDQAGPKPGQNAPESAGSSATADSMATASKKYFQHISLLIDTLRTDVKGAGSPKLARRMVDKAALEIDRLPVLNVDEELIGYGAGVSETFRNMRNMSKYASLDATYRQASMAGNQGYGYGGFYGGGTNLSLSTSVMRKQESAVLAVERVGGLHDARAKDGGDPQENDAQVQSRVLIALGGTLDSVDWRERDIPDFTLVASTGHRIGRVAAATRHSRLSSVRSGSLNIGYTYSQAEPTTGKTSAIQANSVMTSSRTRPSAKPTNETQRARTPVRRPIVDVTNMNTAAILVPKVFISVYAMPRPSR